MPRHWSASLATLNACHEAREWAATQPSAAVAADAAADAAAWRQARAKALAKMATIVRRHIPKCPTLPE